MQLHITGPGIDRDQERIFILSQDLVTIGRAADSLLHLDDGHQKVSRHHAQIDYQDG
ncbi:MAG: FHA domain-containing protein, partial [Nitrospirae bacterium]